MTSVPETEYASDYGKRVYRFQTPEEQDHYHERLVVAARFVLTRGASRGDVDDTLRAFPIDKETRAGDRSWVAYASPLLLPDASIAGVCELTFEDGFINDHLVACRGCDPKRFRCNQE